MAFASAITKTIQEYWGTKKAVWGTYTNDSLDTGGDIDTGLRSVDFLFLQSKGSAVVTDVPVVDETLPADGSAITIVTAADDDGYWFAIGD